MQQTPVVFIPTAIESSAVPLETLLPLRAVVLLLVLLLLMLLLLPWMLLFGL